MDLLSTTKFKVLILVGLTLLSSFLLLFKLHEQPLQRWDEQTNLDVISHSAAVDDWWNLRLNNGYFWEKPPLYYYAGIAAYKFSQVLNLDPVLTLRLLTIVPALILVLLIYLFCRHKYGQKAALLGVGVLLSAPALWLMNPQGIFASHNLRSLDSDTLQLLMIVSGYILYDALSNRAHDQQYRSRNKLERRLMLLLIGISVVSGLGFMFKGLFGLLPIIIVIAGFVVKFLRRQESVKQLTAKLAYLLLPAALIILPWHVYMLVHFGGDFFNSYFGYHQLARGFSTLEGHSEPLLFYVQILLTPLFSGSLIPLLICLVGQFLLTRKLTINLPLVLIGLLMLGLAVMQTKLSWYSLYLYPFIALAVASSLRSTPKSRGKLTLMLILAVYIFVQLITIIAGLSSI